MSRSSDLALGIDPDLGLSTSGIPYDIDLFIGGYTDAGAKVLPTFFYFLFNWNALRSSPKDLDLSAGTLFPKEVDGNPFQFSDFGLEVSFCFRPPTLDEAKDSGIPVSRKIGPCSHCVDHVLRLYMTRSNGKSGTALTLGDDFYYGTMGADLCGVQAGAFVLAFRTSRFDPGIG